VDDLFGAIMLGFTSPELATRLDRLEMTAFADFLIGHVRGGRKTPGSIRRPAKQTWRRFLPGGIITRDAARWSRSGSSIGEDQDMIAFAMITGSAAMRRLDGARLVPVRCE
jgi:hypothetical protein